MIDAPPAGGASLRAGLDRLRRALDATPAPRAEELAPLGDARALDLLFRLLLGTVVRAGPEAAATTPRRILDGALDAAARGLLAIATPAALRRTLERLETETRAAGLWAPEAPLWWRPLPPPAPLERLRRRLDEAFARLPPRRELAALFAGPEAPRRTTLPGLVEPELLAAVWAELETGFDAGTLALERGGVGARGEVGARRADSVRYLDGTEPELLAAAPHLASLVQWLLDALGPRLGGLDPGRRRYPPLTAMLARYPAPSGGYDAHVDNPGGERDNGRALTLVLYLNPPGARCAGGEIALWDAESDGRDAAAVPAAGGSAVLFDARTIVHRVRPLEPGPARWALTLWLNDAPPRPVPAARVPRLAPRDAVLPIASPPLAPDTVLWHELDDRDPAGELVARSTRGAGGPRAGVVATVYREGATLDGWCAHHVALGFDHLVLVFDRLEEASEAADAERLRAVWPAETLTILDGGELADARWPALPAELRTLRAIARSGATSHAVAARQTLHASSVLEAARGDELGGAPLDWLLHLDADERFWLEGPARGGATLAEHLAAAADAGVDLVRYVNHELLRPGDADRAPVFKRNPRFAAARLGQTGWSKLVAHLEMAQTDPRPYFHGYFNGKSAVRVAAARAAAGVHGWALADPAGRGVFLAGPSVLHLHFATAAAFREKYLRVAASPPPPGEPLFEPCPAEEAALALIRALRADGVDDETLHRRLDALHRTLTCFSKTDVEMLEAAGLLLRP